MLVCIILTIISIGFWSIYMQTFSSVLLFADRNMSTHFLFMTINSEFTQSFNPFYIIVLSPLLMWLWPKLSQRNWNPSYPTKFALGVFLIALGAGLLVIATTYFSPKGLTNPWWLAGGFGLLHGMGFAGALTDLPCGGLIAGDYTALLVQEQKARTLWRSIFGQQQPFLRGFCHYYDG